VKRNPIAQVHALRSDVFFSKAMLLQLPPLNGAQVCACKFFNQMRPHLLRGLDVQWMDSAELCASNYRA
jgi:hypothetical protein